MKSKPNRYKDPATRNKIENQGRKKGLFRKQKETGRKGFEKK